MGEETGSEVVYQMNFLPETGITGGLRNMIKPQHLNEICSLGLSSTSISAYSLVTTDIIQNSESKC